MSGCVAKTQEEHDEREASLLAQLSSTALLSQEHLS
jgi:hypothetical protein